MFTEHPKLSERRGVEVKGDDYQLFEWLSAVLHADLTMTRVFIKIVSVENH